MTQAIAKPLPNISDFNRPFWEGAKRHEFMLQRCNACSNVWAPNGPVCPFCFSTDYRWDKLSGRGKIASWVVFHKLYHPSFAEDVPYNVAFVELDEGPRIIANVIGTPNKDITIGMPVEVTFEDVNEQISIPRFPENIVTHAIHPDAQASRKVPIADARALAVAALKSLKFDDEQAAVTADHLVDAALRGVTFGSLPRILSIAEKMAEEGDNRRPISVIRESPVSALIDGGDQVGYVVAHHATRMAVEKAKKSGIAIVGANNTYYTGLFSFYMEMATREGLVALAIGNGPAIVAPEGAIDARLGTNPIAFGFPSEGDPIIWDIGTCAIMHGEVQLHRRLGEPLPEGTAIDKDGKATRDPTAALAGAIKAWGGHRGSGLSIVVQLLGAMCDAPVISPGMKEMAYLVVVIDPKLLMPEGDYPSRVTELSEAIRSARPAGDGAVRMPFDRSVAERSRRNNDGSIEVPERVYQALTSMAAQKT